MPSQEDYLDNLLKDVTGSDELQDNVAEQDAAAGQEVAAPDLDAVTGMSEDEIDRLLSAGAGQEDDEFSNASDMDLSDADVLKMLEDSDDEELQDIQELLQKSDNNEAIDDSITALLEDYPEEDLEAKIIGSGNESADREEKKRLAKEERARQKEEAAARMAEKRAAKKAAREAAKEAKAAAKAEKAKRGNKADNKAKKLQKKLSGDSMQDETEEQDVFDSSVLDSIVSEADRAGKQPEKKSAPVFEAADNEEEASHSEGADSQDSDLNLDSLFGDGDADAALLGGSGVSDFPDFLEADADADLLGLEEKGHSNKEDASKQKQGFFAKILNFLTEEDEEENEDIKLSKENKDILDDLDKEEKGKKSKKSKKGKKGKDKGKDKDKDSRNIKEKPKKAKKPPKPKKEKAAKEAPKVPEKRLSFKKVLPVLLVGLSIGVLLFVFVNSAADFSDKKAAKEAYYEGDYQTCYQNLFGKDLNETESIMFGKSESILYIRLWIREYEMFMGEGERVKALDSLIQTIDSYPGLYQYAGQWNAEPEIAEGYAIILNYLFEEFGLTEGQAQTIASVRSDKEYTRMVTAIAGGRTFENWDAPAVPEVSVGSEGVQEPEEQIPDILPEEDELGNDTFIDNQ